MRLKRLHIKGYRSLKDIELTFDNFQVLVGPNASGKTNIFKAIQFISNIYQWDLDKAIRAEGGYDSLCYKGPSDTPGELFIETEFLSYQPTKLISGILHKIWLSSSKHPNVGRYNVIKEEFILTIRDKTINFKFPLTPETQSLNIENINKIIDNNISGHQESDIIVVSIVLPIFGSTDFQNLVNEDPSLLVLERLPLKQVLFNSSSTKWNSFNLSAHISRNSSVQSNIAALKFDGSGLADVVHYISHQKPSKWQKIFDFLTEIIPEIQKITTAINTNKQVEIFFYFEGVEHPFTASDVSDGTILLLATLCAIVADDSALICIDEPENSLHPWAIDKLVAFCRAQSQNKIIMLATQSLQVIDALYPREILCVYRADHSTHIKKLNALDASLEKDWEEGNLRLSTIFSSGLIPQTVPKYE
jgi:predicted ATPase